MTIEIDQSGKLEQLNTDTIIAFANGKKEAILIKAGTKRKIVGHLRKTLIPHKDLYPILFSVLIFLLIKNLPKTVVVKIDEEYTGKEQIIEETLEKLLRNHFGRTWQGILHFVRVGKHSNAHKLAWGTYRDKRRVGIRRITEQEVLELISL